MFEQVPLKFPPLASLGLICQGAFFWSVRRKRRPSHLGVPPPSPRPAARPPGRREVVADVSFDATGALVATGSVDRTAKALTTPRRPVPSPWGPGAMPNFWLFAWAK